MAATAPEKQLVRAQAKWVRMSARKGRVVAEHIRGRSVPEARAVLAFTQRAAAREIEKVLSSAVANAEANNGLDGDDLVVYTVVRRRGPTLKRWKARARGRVARIKKRTCHITLTLTPLEAPVAAPPKKASAEAEAPSRGRGTTPEAQPTGARRSRRPRSRRPRPSPRPSPSRARPRRKKTEE